MKRALSNIKSCTKISRNQLKFIELVLGLNKDRYNILKICSSAKLLSRIISGTYNNNPRISFHTFTVMATLIDHMSHKDPSTLAMFDSIDMTRLEHDLPRLKVGSTRLCYKVLHKVLHKACLNLA